MDEILLWLRQRVGGLATYEQFHERMIAQITANPEQAAAARLLAELASRFVDALDRQPLPSPVDVAAQERLIGFVERAITTREAAAESQLAFLNELAAAELTS